MYFDQHCCSLFRSTFSVPIVSPLGYKPALPFLLQGPRSKFASGGAKEECVKENLGGGGRGGRHACGFLFNFSTVTENANNDKTIDFFPHLQ